MGKKSVTTIFLFSFTSLIISLMIFWNIGVYVDEYGTGVNVVYGGIIFSYLAWLNLALLFVITLISFLNLAFVRNKRS